MRNREAARYARWAAIAAGLIALSVVGVYVERSFRQSRARRAAPAAVPVTVEQQSNQFSFSKVVQDRTLFTIRASHLTQYKDQNRALLEDVWITIYGRDGSRNDNIHTHECSYEPETGAVRCEGEVRIDIENVTPTQGKPVASSGNALEVKTSNLSFDRDTGEASTPAPVEFRFPAGQGRGVGVSYSTSDSVVRVEHGVEFELTPSEETEGLPVSASGSSLEIRRSERAVVLGGPAIVREGTRELTADQVTVELDEGYHARRVTAEGRLQIHAAEGGAKIAISAAQVEGILSPAGWVERVIADGNIKCIRQTAAGTDRFAAAHAEFSMLPERNLIQEMTATGGVTVESRQGSDSRVLETDALRMTFTAGGAGKPSGQAVAAPADRSSKRTAEQQRIESAETLGPATIESRSGDDTTNLRAKKFVARMGANGRIESLLGHSGVEVRSQKGTSATQSISAAELAATFGADGEWDTLDESGDVRFQQGDREASAAHARIVRATDTITLDGAPVISDSMSRTTAANAVINQKSGDLRLTGGVVSTYLPATQGDAVSLGSGAAHISADTLLGSSTSGHVVYAGHGRLWQGESVLDADRIELWREDKKLQASGRVVAIFPQASGPFAKPIGQLPGSSSKAAPGASIRGAVSSPGPTLWRIVAPALTYWNDQGKAHLEGGVVASSDQGSLESRTLDVFLGPAAPSGPATSSQTAATPLGTSGGRQLNRVLAMGDVVVRQGERRGMADQGEYTAGEGKFVLSGGQPTVSDNSSNTATGHSLTFFVANDTILIDSQEGSRTLTKHRVEK
ncbi:MAG: LPS export ABC transporter periplasmic protein LptC [Candidatus Acidiferrales bacterium]